MSVPVLSSSSQLSIQGVHASNLSSTPILTTYPSGTTSTSVGHYHFLDSNNASNHLNCSALNNGGHIFSHSSSTEAPTTILKVNREAMTLDTILRNTTNKTYIDMSGGIFSLTNNDFSNVITQGYVIK